MPDEITPPAGIPAPPSASLGAAVRAAFPEPSATTVAPAPAPPPSAPEPLADLQPWKLKLEVGEAQKPWLQAVYGWAKDSLHKLVGGLFMEQKTDQGEWFASKGSVMLWIVFLHCVSLWRQGKDPGSTEVEVLYVLIGYALATKVGGGAKAMLAMFKGGGDAGQPPAA